MTQKITKRIKGLFAKLLNIIYPEHCGFCGREVSMGKWICLDCAERIPLERCSGELPEKYHNAGFDKLFYAGLYFGRTRDGILRLKKGKGRNAAKYLSAALADNIIESGLSGSIDCIVYVPVSREKKIKRGFDHAEIIAKLLSQKLGIPIVNGALRRKSTNKSQHLQISYADRFTLAQKVFTYPKNSPDLFGKTILLCDDIITSGATLSKCAHILKDLGADYVYAAVLVKAGS